MQKQAFIENLQRALGWQVALEKLKHYDPRKVAIQFTLLIPTTTWEQLLKGAAIRETAERLLLQKFRSYIEILNHESDKDNV
jgi:hypothetical protein